MEFDSHLQQTGVLYGEVLGAQIACTNLNGDYPGIEYDGKFGSWDGQNLFEAKLILGLMKSFENGSPQVILGDFNSGPAIPEHGISAQRPETYEKFIEKGFHSGNVLSPKPFCTWCPNNNNLIPDPREPASIVDHVFVKNADSRNPKRFWDFQKEFTYQGQKFPLNLSDHFATRITIEWPVKGEQATLLPNRVPMHNGVPISELQEIAPVTAPVPQPKPQPQPQPQPVEVIAKPERVVVQPTPVYEPSYTPPVQPTFVHEDPVVSNSGSAIVHPEERREQSKEVYYEGEDPYVKLGEIVGEVPEGAEKPVTTPSVFSSLYQTDSYGDHEYQGLGNQAEQDQYGDYEDDYGDW